MKNYMEEVAHMLGVELGEDFKIDFGYTRTGIAMFDEKGLHIKSTNLIMFGEKSEILQWLLNGYCTVERIPWKPKFEERYYSIGVDGSVEDGTWLNDFLDYSLYKLGNCYRTPEAARANRSKWGAFYSSDEVLKI